MASKRKDNADQEAMLAKFRVALERKNNAFQARKAPEDRRLKVHSMQVPPNQKRYLRRKTG